MVKLLSNLTTHRDRMQHIGVIPSGLDLRLANPRIRVCSPQQAAGLNPQAVVERIIWGWKRDADNPRLSRTVYFGGRYVVEPGGAWLEDPFFFYAHWGPDQVMQEVTRNVALPYGGLLAATTDFEVKRVAPGMMMLRIVSGRPTPEDLYRLERLASRQPDPLPPTPPQVPSSNEFNLTAHGITCCDLLAGSGLSYEAGLPMLKEVHDLFWVDDGYDGFCLGDKDKLPGLLFHDLESTFRSFASWHTRAASARPSEAHLALLGLRRAGFLNNLYTDNIDRLFDLAGLDNYTQVRGSGVVNEFCPVEFHPQSDALLVVGVSADRRSIIAQARQHGLRLVVINPYIPVSPGAKNLDYLSEDDVYFRMTAGDALPRIVLQTLGSRPVAMA